jgi:ribosomal protein S18 acetylase RimI-like enzyme
VNEDLDLLMAMSGATAADLDVERFREAGGEVVVVHVKGAVPFALLHSLHVHPALRGQGMARRLMVRACEHADRRSWRLQLVAAEEDDSVDLDRLVRFYESLGFAETYRFTAGGVTRPVMERPPASAGSHSNVHRTTTAPRQGQEARER